MNAINTEYVGPDATCREDAAFQLERALRDRDLTLLLMRMFADRSRTKRGRAALDHAHKSLPAIEDRVALHAAEVLRLYRATLD